MSNIALSNTVTDVQLIDSATFEFVSAVSYDTIAELCVTEFDKQNDDIGSFYLGNCKLSLSTFPSSEGSTFNDLHEFCDVVINVKVNNEEIETPAGVVSQHSLKPFRVFFKKLHNCISQDLGYHFIAMTNTEVPILDADVAYSKPFKLLVFNKQCNLVCILDSRHLRDYNKYYCSNSKFATLISWLPLNKIQKMLFNKIP